MTPMMSLIFWEEPSISSMAETARPTMAPPSSALVAAMRALSRARPAFSAVVATVWLTSESAATVSSIEAACCSVRWERSLEATAISDRPVRMVWTEETTPPIASSS